MTKPLKATSQGLKPHYKVRAVFPNALVHLASWDKPRATCPFGEDSREMMDVVADWIDDPAYGDSIVFVDWTQLVAMTVRYSE